MSDDVKTLSAHGLGNLQLNTRIRKGQGCNNGPSGASMMDIFKK